MAKTTLAPTKKNALILAITTLVGAFAEHYVAPVKAVLDLLGHWF